VNVYDPKVDEAQIWLDLTEACPHLPLDTSACIHCLKRCSSLTLMFLVVKKQVNICKSAYDACTKAEAIVVATEWKEFREIAWQKVYDQMNKPAFVFDGRLLLDAEELRKIGFKVRALCMLNGELASLMSIITQVATIGRGERL
jgi:UDPglucose 6-dehydrogenase